MHFISTDFIFLVLFIVSVVANLIISNNYWYTVNLYLEITSIHDSLLMKLYIIKSGHFNDSFYVDYNSINANKIFQSIKSRKKKKKKEMTYLNSVLHIKFHKHYIILCNLSGIECNHSDLYQYQFFFSNAFL